MRQQAEKARITIDNQNKTHFSLLVFVSNFEGALLILISLNKHETWTFIQNFSKQIWGVEGAALLWLTPGGTQPRYANGSMQTYFNFADILILLTTSSW